MYNKHKFVLEMEKLRQEQVTMLPDYLADFIKNNYNASEMPLFDDNIKASEEIIAAVDIPQHGRDFKEVLDELVEHVLKHTMTIRHPRFFSFVTSTALPYSLAGSVLTDIYNPNGGGYQLAPMCCQIEEKLVKWMGSLAGYPQDSCNGVFTSGGSMSNLTGMIAARNRFLDEMEYPIGVAYLSDQAHSSVAKGLRLMGLRQDQIIKIPTDDVFKMRMDLLEEHIKKDIEEGKKPFLVVGSMGTTNTGSIDPLSEIGALCKQYGMWFHVDGAYGGSILISDIYRNYAKGIELSDSFSWDTHKWLGQTYSCSTIIVRDKVTLLDVFSEHPEYLEDIRDSEHNDPWDLGPELSRPHRSLKLWVTLQAMGTDKLTDIVDYAFLNAHTANKCLRSLPNWEITSPPMCGAITFRFAPSGFSEEELNELNSNISAKIIRDDYAYIVTSVVKNKRVLRMCMINGNATTEDVIDTINYLDRIANELVSLPI